MHFSHIHACHSLAVGAFSAPDVYENTAS